MRTVEVDLGTRTYPIHIGAGVLDDVALVQRQVAGSQVFVVTNDVVAPLYLDRVCRALGNRQVDVHVLPDGEMHKTLDQYATVLDSLLEARHHRTTTVVALGGGVVGDLAGFVAASYQRGVAFLQVPTTLLAQVDSSVGGKTAVNHTAGKNMIGAFHQPCAVLADTRVLATLPERELVAGIAEIIKYGVIADTRLFAWLEDNIDALRARDGAALVHAIARSCEIKAGIVAADERETGVRAHLNFGHTFGHAIEHVQGYGAWLHGEAVGVGMLMAAELSSRQGLLTAADANRIRRLIERAGLPTAIDGMPSGRLLDAMALDKKVHDGQLRFVLTGAIGQAEVRGDVPAATVLTVLQDAGAT